MYLNLNSSSSLMINTNEKDTKEGKADKANEENGKSDSGIFLKHYLAIKNKNGLWQ